MQPPTELQMYKLKLVSTILLWICILSFGGCYCSVIATVAFKFGWFMLFAPLFLTLALLTLNAGRVLNATLHKLEWR